MLRCRRAATLLELAITLALGALVLGLIVATGVQQSRTYRGIADLLFAENQLRHATAILPVDLRGISAAGGDLPAGEARDTSLELRAMVGTSVTCAVTATGLVFPPAVPGHGFTSFISPLDVGDTAWVYGDSAGVRAWRAYAVAAISTSYSACPSGNGGSLISGGDADQPGLVVDLGLDSATSAVARGLPVRFTRLTRYSLYRSADHAWYLGMRAWNSDLGRFNQIQPVSGPYAGENGGGGGLHFDYRDSLGDALPSPVPNTRQVALIEVFVRTQTLGSIAFAGPQTGVDGRHADSATIAIALRNRR